MKQLQLSLRLLSLTALSALALTSCSTNDPSPEPAPSENTQVPDASATAPAPSPGDSQSPSADESDNSSRTGETDLSQTQEIMGIGFQLPAEWYVEEDCDGECIEYDKWEIKDRSGAHVMTLLPNTATSPDGDMNLYERELLKEVPIPALETPTSLIAEFWTGTSQDDGEKETGFSLALVDDQVLKERTEQPDLDYFKIGDSQAPMLWVEEEYMEDQGIGDDPTREGVDNFLASDEYRTIESILLTVRHAAG
ncbi:hypothetical protein ACT3UQ_08200 [Glutamicibacter sp. AOP12-B1-11]|uniref:hypothetical protein n=1 Tax=Micrococcaceae TaxID=1268 RepID=UPI0011B0324B|nr:MULTISPECIES: hypothetical protein [unclassified Arthrobacter]